MLKLGKLLVTLPVLAVATASYALYQPSIHTAPVSSTWSNPFKTLHGWHLTVSDMQYTYGNNGTAFVVSATSNPDLTVSQVDFPTLNNKNYLGYGVSLGYTDDCTGTEIDISFSKRNAKDKTTISSDTVRPIIGDFVGDSSFVSITGLYNYTTVSLTGGYLIHINPWWELFPYAGLNYTHYSRNFTSIAATFLFDNYQAEFGSSLNSYGPTFGLDMGFYPFYCDFPGFSMSAGFQTTFLYGTISSYLNSTQTSPGGSAFRQLNRLPQVKGPFPALTGTLAANYMFPAINNFAVTATLGYQSVFVVTPGETGINLAGAYLSLTGSF